MRQAVVVVHGIGEQRPMATMPAYVDGVVGPHDVRFAGPDGVSGHLEMRRIGVGWFPRFRDGGPSRTDFFELYWAHLLRESELRHVTSWLLSLFSRLHRLPKRMWRFALYSLLPFFVLFIPLMVVLVTMPSVRTLLVTGLLSAAGSWVVWHFGDVPRYLSAVAENVAPQRSIRQEGIRLLEALHELTDHDGSPTYDRVIVIGHSLGSVIAYDIVRFYWTKVNTSVPLDDGTEAIRAEERLEQLGEDLWSQGGAPEPLREDRGFTEFQVAQGRLFEELTQPVWPSWRISDLVTLASPLAYADFLLAGSRRALDEWQWERQLATCPPRRQRSSPTYRYEDPPSSGRHLLHHAAAFAATRWTNLYFGSDVIGGPVAPVMGPGVLDIRLGRPGLVKGFMPVVHSQYAKSEQGRAVLRRIIHDGSSRDDEGVDEVIVESLASAIAELRPKIDGHDGDVSIEDAVRLSYTIPVLLSFSKTHRERLGRRLLERDHLPDIEVARDFLQRERGARDHVRILETLVREVPIQEEALPDPVIVEAEAPPPVIIEEEEE